MAAINRPTTASYEVHETVKVDTEDYEDHTFWWDFLQVWIFQVDNFFVFLVVYII